MKQIKQINTTNFSLTLYEVNEHFIVLKTLKGMEIPSIPSKDLGMALAIFETWYTELNNEGN